MVRSRILLFIIFLALFTLLSPCAFSQEFYTKALGENIADWTVIKSSYADIYVHRDIDLKSVVKKINVNFVRYDPVESKIFLDKDISDDTRLASKIDIIIKKAKEILDMYPQNFCINVIIYGDRNEMWNVYEEIFKERKDYIAFYIHKFRTIYISLNDVSESILAHEIGHAIIDSYFGILPPPKIRELLASYVDVHLKD